MSCVGWLRIDILSTTAFLACSSVEGVDWRLKGFPVRFGHGGQPVAVLIKFLTVQLLNVVEGVGGPTYLAELDPGRRGYKVVYR